MAKPSRKGQDGEIRVALDIATLDRTLYHAVHNVTVKVDDGTTQIDHVVISKYGIFVVETKNYSGWIFGKEREAKWTRSTNGKSDSFQNPIRQNIRHIKSLSELLGVDEYLFHSVIAFCGDAEFKSPMPANVLTTGYADFIRSKQIALFSDVEAATLAEKLKSSMLERGEETDRIHIESLRQRHANKEAADAIRLVDEKQRRDTPRRRRLPAALRDRTAERLGFDIPTKKSRAAKGRTHRRLSVAIVAAVVLLFAANSFIGGMRNLLSDMTTRHQATASIEPPELNPEPAPVKPQPPYPKAAFDPALREALAAPASSINNKEDAWRRWYSPSPECEALTDRNMVQCGNEHIRARQEFERLYDLGKLR
jgi:hypothetical protein